MCLVADLLGQHAAHRGAAHQEHAGHVHRHDVVPFLEAGLGERLAGAHDRVVDDDVEPAGRTGGTTYGFLDIGFLGDVALEERHGQHLVGRFAALDHLLGDVHQQQLGAFLVEPLRDGAADA